MQSSIARSPTLWSLFWSSPRLGKGHEVRRTCKPVEVALGRDAIDRLVGQAGVQLHCSSGCLWITHDGDPKDVVLRAGQHCEARPGCRVLVQALETSTYCVE